jgi:hypothetical protein
MDGAGWSENVDVSVKAPADGTVGKSKLSNPTSHMRPTRVGAFYLAVLWLGPAPPAATPPTLRQATPACDSMRACSWQAVLTGNGGEQTVGLRHETRQIDQSDSS